MHGGSNQPALSHGRWNKIPTDQERFAILFFTSTSAFSQIPVVLRINIRKNEKKKVQICVHLNMK